MGVFSLDETVFVRLTRAMTKLFFSAVRFWPAAEDPSSPAGRELRRDNFSALKRPKN